ncbi:MAG TPA: VLRF1 family aeRF1-type release factor [Streptosporangiaceae bacterium]|nr:VLRF1 family aeRF1-type release factor [Streptosporangiaceae bacterium]
MDKETDAVTLSMELIRDLALRRPGTPVLSVYVRTDPRDPANTAAVPGWLVELRNSLREVSHEVEDRESRERRMAVRDLRERVEHDVLALAPAERGRGLAWFRTADGSFDHRVTLQLPPLATLARWDDRPYVSSLAEVAGRGRPTGLVLVSAEAVRLLHWQDGRVTEPARSLYEIEPGQWRDYDAYIGYPGRSPAGLHVAEFDQRVREWRQRFLRATAQAVGAQVADLGWHRILLAGQPRVTGPFRQQLPERASGLVIATIDANLIWEDHAAVAERLDDALRDASLEQARALADETTRRAYAGGDAAIGWPEVADSLIRHRAGHLIVGADTALDPAVLGPQTQAALGWPSPQMLIERAVEQAVISGAEVTVLPAGTPEPVRAGGAAAILRY